MGRGLGHVSQRQLETLRLQSLTVSTSKQALGIFQVCVENDIGLLGVCNGEETAGNRIWVVFRPHEVRQSILGGHIFSSSGRRVSNNEWVGFLLERFWTSVDQAKSVDEGQEATALLW